LKIDIKKRFILLNVIEKATVSLYTLIDSETGDKCVSIGVKEDNLNNRDLVDVTLSLRTQREKVDTKNDGVKYFEVLNTFVSQIEKVKM